MGMAPSQLCAQGATTSLLERDTCVADIKGHCATFSARVIRFNFPHIIDFLAGHSGGISPRESHLK